MRYSEIEHTLAEYFGVSHQLANHIGFLFQDFFNLGSNADRICGWINDLNLHAGSTVLDLGCGKGEVSVRIAEGTGLNVTGYDLSAAFIDEATLRAGQLGVEDLCTFEIIDLVTEAPDEHGFDVVLLLSVGWLFGTIEDTIGRIRAMVKPGGVIIVDDGYLKPDVSIPDDAPDEYKSALSKSDTESALTAHGDHIEQRFQISRGETLAQNRKYYSRLEKRVAELSEQHPELRDELEQFMAEQRLENKLLEDTFESVTWFLRKAD